MGLLKTYSFGDNSDLADVEDAYHNIDSFEFNKEATLLDPYAKSVTITVGIYPSRASYVSGKDNITTKEFVCSSSVYNTYFGDSILSQANKMAS